MTHRLYNFSNATTVAHAQGKNETNSKQHSVTQRTLQLMPKLSLFVIKH